jgi:micrococcal nuclease
MFYSFKRTLILIILFVAFLLGCMPSQVGAVVKVNSLPENSTASGNLTSAVNSDRIKALVVDVVDGDTIKVKIGVEEFKLRYIGINSPELNSTDIATKNVARLAAEKNRQIVQDKIVELEKDVSETDKYGRLLRYVYINGIMVNAELVKCGLARSVEYPPDIRYQVLFNNLQDSAKSSGQGIWYQGE